MKQPAPMPSPSLPTEHPPARQDAMASPRRVDSQALFNEAREVEIHHHGEVYRLRHTRTGKLILTK